LNAGLPSSGQRAPVALLTIYRGAPATSSTFVPTAAMAQVPTSKNPNSRQESGRAAVKNRMGAVDALRIPAITVASGPMTVKIRRRRLLSVYPGPQRRRIADRFHSGETARARCHD
jgi:hypothetical protein